ncbi:hypothetical protein Taro_031068 [Colocasia esculenta]|uniref:Uncharacterized protein n=1 Tax=Colocasia esculenta TaxID=4460 RepID=A0A843VQW6_COLES|nr:hypothetical protein [Colocasia esculenta]
MATDIVGRRSLVFQILHADYIPDWLADFLEDERFTFVGVGADEDADNLDRHWGLAVGRTKDLRHLVAEASHLPEMRGCGLVGLAEEHIMYAGRISGGSPGKGADHLFNISYKVSYFRSG